MTPEQVRAAMPPEMLAVCEAVKARFPSMRLLYMSTDALTVGRDVVAPSHPSAARSASG